jgi:MGT family glycosyltransferase
MSGHIAFVNIAGPGHVYPTLPVVSELVRRGHRVSYATVAERRTAVEATGARLVPYDSILPDEADPTLTKPESADFLPIHLNGTLDEIEHVLPQLTEAFAADRPDVIVYDATAYAGKIIAAQQNIPAVQAFPFLPASDKWSVAQDFNAFSLTNPAFLRYARRLGRFLKAQGLDWGGGLRAPIERSTVVFVPRSFQPFVEAYPATYHFVGPCIAPRAGYAAWTPPPGAAPVVFATLGTVYNANAEFFRTCVEAFAPAWHLVLNIGPRLDPGSLGPLPSTVDARSHVPQLEVLAHAAVFISHAGMGGLMEAMTSGVPVVCVPQTPEQQANAHRVVELGLGVTVSPGDLSVATLRAAVAEVTGESSYLKRIRELAAEIEAAGGARTAADVIEAAAG